MAAILIYSEKDIVAFCEYKYSLCKTYRAQKAPVKQRQLQISAIENLCLIQVRMTAEKIRANNICHRSRRVQSRVKYHLHGILCPLIILINYG
jgi:hypothetical protein